MKLNGALGDTVDKLKGKGKLENTFEYNREGFNEKCDFVGRWNVDLSPIEFKPKATKEKINSYMFKYLKSFNSEVISKDIKVIYVPPIYNESASILDSKFIEESVSEL